MPNPDPATVEGIIFDLDGTLYRMGWFFRPLLWMKLCAHPLRLPRFLKTRSLFSGREYGSRDELIQMICKELYRSEHTTPEAIRHWILDTFYPAFISTMPLQRHGRPSLVATLKALKSSSIRLAVLSDYHAVKERLAALRIPADLFDITTSCESFGALKPSPAPFLAIAQQWELSPPSVCVVGDRDDTDGEAARRAEMQFFCISDGTTKGQSATFSWTQARQFLAECTHSSKKAVPIACSRESEESSGIRLGSDPE